MNQYTARVASISEPIAGLDRPGGRSIDYSRIITLECPEIAEEAGPGQFVMVNCGENTLPRPFSINRITNKVEIALFFSVLENGIGTE